MKHCIINDCQVIITRGGVRTHADIRPLELKSNALTTRPSWRSLRARNDIATISTILTIFACKKRHCNYINGSGKVSANSCITGVPLESLVFHLRRLYLSTVEKQIVAVTRHFIVQQTVDGHLPRYGGTFVPWMMCDDWIVDCGELWRLYCDRLFGVLASLHFKATDIFIVRSGVRTHADIRPLELKSNALTTRPSWQSQRGRNVVGSMSRS